MFSNYLALLSAMMLSSLISLTSLELLSETKLIWLASYAFLLSSVWSRVITSDKLRVLSTPLVYIYLSRSFTTSISFTFSYDRFLLKCVVCSTAFSNILFRDSKLETTDYIFDNRLCSGYELAKPKKFVIYISDLLNSSTFCWVFWFSSFEFASSFLIWRI